MEGVWTRVRDTKEGADGERRKEREELNWKTRGRGNEYMELKLRMSARCHGNAPSKMRACKPSVFHFLMSRPRFCDMSFPIL
jgi:hypothetical protein